MPICPWKHLIVFVFGAGSCILAVSLIGTVAYNGKFGDNNKFLKYRYGRDRKIGQLTIANVSLAFICVCALLFTIACSVKQLPFGAILFGWILTFLAFLGTIISQILSLTESKYGNAILYSEYNYLDNKKFREYLSEAKYEEGINYSMNCNELLKDGYYNETAKSNVEFTASYSDFSFDDFMIPYYSSGKIVYVPSCKISDNENRITGTFPGIDPCNYQFNDKGSRCIGGWNVGNFKNYWCYKYRQRRDDDKTLKKKDFNGQKEWHASKQRNYISVTSYAAFYEINTIFMGLNCAGFFVLLISIFLNMAFRPFDTNVEDYQKLVSGKEAKSDDSASKPKKDEPVRAKAISESDDED